ncbi:hypothetical protein ACLB2K_011509 [Fragaria x ananassa]
MQDLIEEIFPEDPNENAQRFYKLLEEAETPLYKGCRKYSNLSFLVKLMHIKCSGAWSNDSFGMLLRLLKDAFPMCRKLPSRNYGAKKIVKELGLHYERIDACKNDCIIYYKKYKNRTVCPKCKTPRWKTQGGKGDKKNKKKIPWKVLRYFPLTPRLQRLFMSSKTASIMRWHSEEHVKDGELRHPADSEAWKHFDQTHESFNVDSRNADPKIPLQIMQDDKQNPSNREEHETDEPRSESQPSNASVVQARGDRFLFTFSNERDLNRVKKGGPWAYQQAMILINDYDGFSDIMVVPLDFVWIWVEIEGLPVALMTEATTRPVGETIGTVL